MRAIVAEINISKPQELYIHMHSTVKWKEKSDDEIKKQVEILFFICSD